MSNHAVREVNAQAFDQEVSRSLVPVVADFWAPWCVPCRVVGPILEKIAAEHPGKLTVVTVNAEENPELAARFGIMSFPTVIMLQGGEVKSLVVGTRSQKDYEREFGLV
jgi:thioredoxin 1